MKTFAEKIEEFRALMEAEMQAKLTADKLDCEANKAAYLCIVRPGKKYTKVDTATSGKYMVVNDTGEIFGIKAYGVIHRGHRYGTLDTIEQWYWGGYTGVRKQLQAIAA